MFCKSFCPVKYITILPEIRRRLLGDKPLYLFIFTENAWFLRPYYPVHCYLLTITRLNGVTSFVLFDSARKLEAATQSTAPKVVRDLASELGVVSCQLMRLRFDHSAGSCFMTCFKHLVKLLDKTYVEAGEPEFIRLRWFYVKFEKKLKKFVLY